MKPIGLGGSTVLARIHVWPKTYFR